jgi:hypothetical protein
MVFIDRSGGHHGVHHHGIGAHAHRGSLLASHPQEEKGDGESGHHTDERVASSKPNGRSRPGEHGRSNGDSINLSRSFSPSSTHAQVRRRIQRSLTMLAACEQCSTLNRQ